MIPVTKPFLPDRARLDKYIDEIYDRAWLTNDGPLVKELTKKLEKHLGVENLLLVGNGTLAIQIALSVLGVTNKSVKESSVELKNKVLTTPFTFSATSGAICWEGLEPVYVDVDQDSWCIDVKKIEDFQDLKIAAIMPVHVFGSSCDCVRLEEIASRFNVPLIFDAAHAFNVNYLGKNLLSYGDASTLSFHATKLFHSIEGGAIVFKRSEDLEKAKKIINFGLSAPDRIDCVGINAKMNEFQAAMALSILEEIDTVYLERKKSWLYYQENLGDAFIYQKSSGSPNFSYFPILFNSEKSLLDSIERLSERGISARRYFYPSLNSLDIYTNGSFSCSVSEDISKRILCLPLYVGITKEEQDLVIQTLLG